MRVADCRPAGNGASLALHGAGLACLAVLCRPGVPGLECVQPPREAVVLVSPSPIVNESLPLTSAPAAAPRSAASNGEPPPSPVLGRFDALGASKFLALGGASGHILTGTLPESAGEPTAASGEPGSIVIGNLGAGDVPPASGQPT